MHNASTLRQIVVAAFSELGLPRAESCYEAVFVRDGFYVGRQFRCEDVRAVWLSDQEVVNFYRDDILVKVVPLKTDSPEIKKAA